MTSQPLCIDLFCGLGGWTEGFLAEGYRVVGFDIEVRPYPAQLVIQDVLTIHGSQFRDAAVIVASPPCQEYSKYAMPFGALWEDHDRMDDDGAPPGNYLHKPCPRNFLFERCRIIQREASEAAGRWIPLLIENVRGAQRFVGRSQWNYGSFHLWGDVPALMPIKSTAATKLGGCRSWSGKNGYGSSDYKSFGFNTESQKLLNGVKVESLDGGRRTDVGKVARFTTRDCGVEAEGKKIGGDWFSDPKSTNRKHGSKLSARKLASAQIAKIPLPLAQHIAQVYYPRSLGQAARLSGAVGKDLNLNGGNH